MMYIRIFFILLLFGGSAFGGPPGECDHPRFVEKGCSEAGPPGEQGPQGPKGPPGEKGKAKKAKKATLVNSRPNLSIRLRRK
jgi:hypothetical protein